MAAEEPYYYIAVAEETEQIIPLFLGDVADNTLDEWKVRPAQRLYY